MTESERHVISLKDMEGVIRTVAGLGIALRLLARPNEDLSSHVIAAIGESIASTAALLDDLYRNVEYEANTAVERERKKL